MIEVQQVPGTNIIEMSIEGKATSEEFEAALQTFETALKDHDQIRILEIIGDLDTPPIPWSKFWDDIKFGFEHLSDISHVAVVADQGWIAAWVKALNPLFKADMMVFKKSDVEQARRWLHSTPDE